MSTVRLLLISGIAACALAGCGRSDTLPDGSNGGSVFGESAGGFGDGGATTSAKWPGSPTGSCAFSASRCPGSERCAGSVSSPSISFPVPNRPWRGTRWAWQDGCRASLDTLN